MLLPQFFNNHALGKEWQLAEAGIKDGDEVAVVWCKKRTPPKGLPEEQVVLIKHAEGWITAYAHNQEILVHKGEQVARGQLIARAGASGSVSEPQVHFEVRKGTRALDPLTVLGPQAATN